ncbi:hypothetical protein GF327_03890, partial [Candidatus Woesearchaeota archaeon]|nr:hypothetical protein [Candidatus Woesearchaeota archaeon]
EKSIARAITAAGEKGWKKIIAYNLSGHRFLGCGLCRSDSRIDLYGSSGDYSGSGLISTNVFFHSDAQDQLGQIMKSGRLVVYGDVGQTFLYGAKGGEVYILGNTAGRPLINAVGKPKVVINGTCLDYLAESFMAGDPLNGGGFAIVNCIEFDRHGNFCNLKTPYPGGNLFSLASGGAIYIRDPYNKLEENQLNGGRYSKLSNKDWDLIYPYLKENQELFGIKISDLLTINNQRRQPSEIYKKVEVGNNEVLQ